ncbi:Nitrogen permease reactivator protein [Stylosanthes scabra]|uniref:Nitrogen permease reactivator protein n=1 Tax=Stylosanthes scabra TaxID=79078 RepID=A0ABU6RSY9_9FABA|nr:Nitrogen permease reactivator protein [Stylosanthes scabra]
MDVRTVFSDASTSSGVFYATTMPYNNPHHHHYYPTSSSNPHPPDDDDDDIAPLRLLSDSLASLFHSDFDFYADARIVLADGRELAVHRCILAARSSFFRSFFAKDGEERKKVAMKEVAKEYEVGGEAVGAVVGYLYSGRVTAMEIPSGMCVCVDDECPHFGCRPAVDFMVQVLYASFVFQIHDLVALYQRHLLEILDKVAIDDILVVLSVANICGKMCERLLARCIDLVIKSDADSTTVEKTLPEPVAKLIADKRVELGFQRPERLRFPDKHVKRIHRALDSDDVELVRMLLKEGHTNLDEACALHYAVAYCDAKTTTELLDLGLADVNHKNLRGYSVLHVAAMRKEPKIIVSLLTKGAHPSDLTLDGRKALQISKRLTKAVDYYKSTEEGKVSSKDRLCIEILEQAERRDPLLGEASLSLAMAGDDLRMKLLYLENRVGLAKVLFPMEAKVVMDIAQVDGTSEFQPQDIYPQNMRGSTVDLNETPFKMKEEHLARMKALSRTVELGKRFFPRCSAVLNKIMDADDLTQLACMNNDSPEERLAKRRRYMELQEILSKAFNEDKEEFDKSAISSSSSSTSVGVIRPNGKLPIRK